MKGQQLTLKSVLRPPTVGEIREYIRQKLKGYELRQAAREQHRVKLNEAARRRRDPSGAR